MPLGNPRQAANRSDGSTAAKQRPSVEDVEAQAQMKNLFLAWGVDLNSGYGLLGYNIFAQLARDPDLAPMLGVEITPSLFAAVDTLRQQRMLPAILRSNEYLTRGRVPVDGKRQFDAIMIHAVNPSEFEIQPVWGSINVGRCVFENTRIPAARHDLSVFDALLCASRWNAQLIEEATGRKPHVIHEGVDVSIFSPAPRSQIMDPHKFYVFSGGKIEFRKAQDLVIRAFRVFAKKHSDAFLVTAWDSPWSHLTPPNFKASLDFPLQTDAAGRPDITRWAVENGVPTGQFLNLGVMPNMFMPMILREMDVAVQPSRAEACTNLPVKEAMACGVPVIVAPNTGMLDLATSYNCLQLTRQSAVPQFDQFLTQGWGESDVDEIIELLEKAYAEREQLRRIGQAGCRWIMEHSRTWQHHAQEVKEYVLGL